ncbi:MAG TPA: cache domain-containing protein [Gallionella sp.]|nr:cache domain-containing protein [Gallionella sp.]
MFERFFLKFFALLMVLVTGLGLAQAPGPQATFSQGSVAEARNEADAQSLLSAFASYTDLRMSGIQQNLETLASTTEARSGKWEQMKPLLSGYQRSDAGLVVWFVRPDGTYYTVDKGLMDATLRDRDYFPSLMSGRNVMGALVISKSTGQRSAVIAVPMKKDGKVIGAIGASLFLDKLSDQIDAILALRPDVAFFSLAPNGRSTLHKQTDRRFVDPRELGSETLKRAANVMLSNPAGEATYEFDNATKKAIYRTSPLTQWKFAITFSDAHRK